jgi:hypothetical protein
MEALCSKRKALQDKWLSVKKHSANSASGLPTWGKRKEEE